MKERMYPFELGKGITIMLPWDLAWEIIWRRMMEAFDNFGRTK